MASSKSSKARKNSISKPDIGRNPSLTDSSLFGLLSVINLDDICHKTFPINAVLPDGTRREVSCKTPPGSGKCKQMAPLEDMLMILKTKLAYGCSVQTELL